MLTAILIPVGMGYAQAAGLPPITRPVRDDHPAPRLRASSAGRILVLGPDSSLAALIAATVAPLALGDPTRATDLAAGLALISGAFCIAFGVLRLGLLTDLLSKPIRIGYLNGIALTVFVGQLPKLFGFSVERDGVVGIAAPSSRRRRRRDGPGRAGDRSRSIASSSCCRRWLPAIPGVLIAAVGGDRVVAVLGLAASAGVPVVGPLPQGLPTFGIPAVSLEDMRRWSPAAWRSRSSRWPTRACCRGPSPREPATRVDQNQELLALGVGEPRRRPVPRVLDQRQRVADAGRGAGRRQDPAGRRRRGARRSPRCSSSRPGSRRTCRRPPWPRSS